MTTDTPTTVTFCVPCAPYHRPYLERAVASIDAQTVPCKVLTAIDHEQRGPGYVRNRLLEQVETPYVAFLDADDWIEPVWAERCMSAIRDGRYVYTGWFVGNERRDPPRYAWCGGSWHVVTALLPAAEVRRVGGFDETLPAMEDTDFYMRLTTSGVCGIPVNEPLFHYGEEGMRATNARASGVIDELKKEIGRRYARKMGCCGNDRADVQQPPVGEAQPGDVLAQAQWRGNRQVRGKTTGRFYGRLAYPRTAWIDPRDAHPNEWRVVDVQTVGQAQPVRNGNGDRLYGIDALMQQLVEVGEFQPAVPMANKDDLQPDFETVLDIAEVRLDD